MKALDLNPIPVSALVEPVVTVQFMELYFIANMKDTKIIQ